MRLLAAGDGGKDYGCPIALMHIAIERHGRADLFITLHAPDCNRNVVDHAKALAVVREGVMETAADADGDAIVERVVGGQHGTTSGHPKSAHELGGIWNLHFQLFTRAQRAGLEFLHVLRCVHQQNVFVAG